MSKRTGDSESSIVSSAARLPSGGVTARFGISRRTLDRWMRSEKLRFPVPIEINNRLYFAVAEIDAWERDCAVKQAGGKVA